MKIKVSDRIYWINSNLMIFLNGAMIGVFFIYCSQITFPILIVCGLCFLTFMYAFDVNKQLFDKRKFEDSKLKNYVQCLLLCNFILGIMCGLIVDIDTTVLIIVWSIAFVLFFANVFASYSFYLAKLLKYKKERHSRFKKKQEKK